MMCTQRICVNDVHTTYVARKFQFHITIMANLHRSARIIMAMLAASLNVCVITTAGAPASFAYAQALTFKTHIRTYAQALTKKHTRIHTG